MDLAVVHPFLYTRGGAERVVLKIAQHFNAKIFCSRYDPENTFPEFKDLDVEVLGKGFASIVPSFLPVRLRDAIVAGYQFYTKKFGDFDVYNAQGTPSQWVRNKNTNVLWYCHSPNREAFDLYGWRMSRRNFLEKIPYNLAVSAYKRLEFNTVPKLESVLANSRNTQMRLKKYLNLDAEVLNPGVDYEDFYCGGYEKYFFYPSRIAPEKRFEYAISAFKKFSEKNKGFRLVIAGALFRERTDHVEYYNKLKRLLGSSGEILTDVSWSRMLELFANSYSVLYTPKDEDFGIIPLEAMAAKKPCIAVNEGGPREVVVDGETGYLIDSLDDMVSKMEFLASNQNIVEELGKAGRKRVEENFGWDVFLKKFGEKCGGVARSI